MLKPSILLFNLRVDYLISKRALVHTELRVNKGNSSIIA